MYIMCMRLINDGEPRFFKLEDCDRVRKSGLLEFRCRDRVSPPHMACIICGDREHPDCVWNRGRRER